MPRPILSPGALRVHASALLTSIEAGRAGFVHDRDLRRLEDRDDSRALPVQVLELCVAGVWTIADDGYRVVESEALRMVGEVHRTATEAPSHEASPDAS